jgi:acetyl esterase/lipase
MNCRHTTCFVFFLLTVAFVNAQRGLPISLYTADSIPNSKTAPATYKETYANGNYTMVTNPSITPFFPKAGIATGTAVLVIPGGGYEAVAIDPEGYVIAQKFCDIGITAFVLKYRLPDDRIMIDRSIGPLQDAQRAIQIIRQRAGEWNLDTNKTGVIGFSAGGHLASTLGTHLTATVIDNKENINLRPDFMILMYPVITMGNYTHQGSKNALIGGNAPAAQVTLFSNEKQVTSDTPPTFIAHAYTDPVVPAVNSTQFYYALLNAKVICEKHFYNTGGHGFGLTSPNPQENLIDLIQNWLKANGWAQQLTAITDLHAEDSLCVSAFPNPFTNNFTVSYRLPDPERIVALEIYDSKGQLLENISQKDVEADKVYTQTFKANQFNEGIYFVKLITAQKTHSIKLVKRYAID